MKADFFLQVSPSTPVPVAEPMAVDVVGSMDASFKISSFTALSLKDAQVTRTEVIPNKIHFEILPLAAGNLDFPSLNITLDSEKYGRLNIQSPPVSIAVVNPAEGSTASPPLRDIKGPVSAGLNPMIFVWALIVLAGAGLFWYAKRRQRPGPTPPPAEPPRPAHEIALEKIEEAHRNYLKNLDIMVFYWNLSLALREYLGRRFGIDAMERTTSEIFSEMRKNSVDSKACGRAREILSAADLVKFAKWAPAPGEVDQDLARARAFIEETA